MDSYKSLRLELENFASELTVDKFQALGPGMGLGTLQNTNKSASNPAVREFKAASMQPKPQPFPTQYTEDRIVFRSRRAGDYNAPFWLKVLGHFTDLVVAGLCLIVCILGFKLMTNDVAQLRNLKFDPLIAISGIYITFFVYGLTFKVVGLPMLGSHIRHRFSPHEGNASIAR